MTVRITTARWIVKGTDVDGAPQMLDDAALAHENGTVLAVGPALDNKATYPDAPVASYPHHLILPGLINAHHHVGLTPLQMGAPDSPLELWFAARLASRLTPLAASLMAEFWAFSAVTLASSLCSRRVCLGGMLV